MKYEVKNHENDFDFWWSWKLDVWILTCVSKKAEIDVLKKEKSGKSSDERLPLGAKAFFFKKKSSKTPSESASEREKKEKKA